MIFGLFACPSFIKPDSLQEHPYPVELTILSFGIGNVEEVNELIKRYGLEEDLEHVIIPIHDKDGHTKRCYLLKRRFMKDRLIELIYERVFIVLTGIGGLTLKSL